MKRILIILLLILFGWFAYTVVTTGYENEKLSLKIAGYTEIQDNSEQMTKELAAYNKRNKNDYESALSKLDIAIKGYKDTKAEYERILEEMNISQEPGDSVVPQKEIYNIDYLFTKIGTYAKKQGVDLNLKLEKQSGVDTTTLRICYLYIKIFSNWPIY